MPTNQRSPVGMTVPPNKMSARKLPFTGSRNGCAAPLRCGLFARLQEGQQVGIDLVGIGCGHPVPKPWIHLKRRTLHKLRGLQSRCADRHDLVIVAMKNESGHVELLEVLR